MIPAATRGASGDAIPRSRALLRDEIYTQIRTDIVQGRLAPGVRLRDREIAQSLGVSRMPVREAIRRLHDEGLVVAEASRWTRVAAVDTSVADEIYPIVGALERLAVLLGGPWASEQLDELASINDRLAQALTDADDVRASQADSDFHSFLLRRSRNQRLYAAVRDLKVHLQRVAIVYFGGASAGSRSVEEHQAVITALARGDVEGAARAVEENWRGPLERLHARLSAPSSTDWPAP